MLTANQYIESRKRLAEAMMDNSFYICHSGREVESTHDECYPFEVYRNFYYLTGVDRADCILLITKTAGKVMEYLFMHVPSEMEQRWMNLTWEPDRIREETGIKEIRDNQGIEAFLSRLLMSGIIQDGYMDMMTWSMNYAKKASQEFAARLQEVYPYLHLHNAYPIVCKLRTIKSDEEIAAHRKAVRITKDGVMNMLKNMKPGMYEYQIEAYYDFVLKSNGVRTPAFTTIAAAGQNANHMHYADNNCQTKDGDLILFDLGARWDYYCADVSRTYPVNGRFTERQKQLYMCVLRGLQAAEEAAKPGVVKDELQLLSKKVMAEELIKIGKIEKPEEIDRYYMHGSGHNIGLDTHDVGDRGLILQKNLMFTLEPGLYFDDEETGIRIEDTLLVTDTGVDILSDDIPKNIEDIERIMRG